jgi:trehalose utilization protein
MSKIRVTVWGENVHEQTNAIVRDLYPTGMHQCITDALNAAPGIQATTATLDQPDHGLPPGRLDQTDVLIWWGHAAHGQVRDEIVEQVASAVWSGMGAIFLHSAHFSKPFKRLMGTPCNLTWREAGERERLWLTSRNHPIAAGLPDHFELETEEMYGEPFGIPEPLETVFISWFQGGEVFRSGATWKRGAGMSSTSAPGTKPTPPTMMPTCSASSPTPSAGRTTRRAASPTLRPPPMFRLKALWSRSPNAARSSMPRERQG